VTLRPNYPGKVINNANIEAKNIPINMAPPYAANTLKFKNIATSKKTDVPSIPINKNFNLSEILPFT
jgi:hypothetical protein